MRWQGLLGAVPASAGAIALLELTRLPVRPALLLGALSSLARDAVTQFAAPALLLAAAAAVLLAMERAGSAAARWAGRAALVGLAAAQSVAAREVLIAYPPFSWSFPANVGFVALGGGLAAVHLWLASARLARHRRATGAAGGLLALGSLGLARVHYAVYVGQYPTLHECTLSLCFLGLALGLALSFAAIERGGVARHAPLALAAAVFLVAALDLPSSAAARPYVIAYTELGRAAGVAEALERDRENLLPRTRPGPRASALLRPDPDAAARFARHCGLPPLPAGFDLSAHDVLLVLSDATRYDRTSLPARGRPAAGPTPHLARLGARSRVFERAMAPSNGTFPSLAAMLAMTPASFAELDVRPRFWRGRLRAERTTAAEAMRRAGRATFWVGHDHRGCFSRNIAGLEQGFDERTLVPQARGEPAHADADARIADAAIARVRRHRRAGERYFGLVFFVSPHDDYQVHDPEAPADTALERYDQELAFMDAQLGRLLDALEADGALSETVVVFAGDHGEAFGEHGHRHHLSSVHDEQIHVPLVVHVPGMAPARHARPTSTAYVLPWLLRRGAEPERAAARAVLTEDVGPLMRALDGAVISEMIGPRRQAAALVWPDLTVTYDLLSDLSHVYDPRRDPAQRHDLREARPDLLERVAPLVRRYRRARFEGRRFRFVEPPEQP
jgi:arylsulfatase A-like enzyme